MTKRPTRTRGAGWIDALTDEELDALETRLAARREARRTPTASLTPTELDRAAMRALMARMGMQPEPTPPSVDALARQRARVALERLRKRRT